MCNSCNAQGTIAIGNWHIRHYSSHWSYYGQQKQLAVVYDELPSKNCSDIDQICGSLNISLPIWHKGRMFHEWRFPHPLQSLPQRFCVKSNINVAHIWLWGELRVFLFDPFVQIPHLQHSKQVHSHWLWHIYMLW